MEKFKAIPEYPKYAVSTLGRVIRDGREIDLFKVRGYLSFNVADRSRRKSYRVHRIAAILFLPNPKKLPAVRHLDGNKENCAISNLKWGTHLENEQDKRDHGRLMEGEKHHRARLTNEDVIYIRSSKESHHVLSDRFKVSQSHISSIRIRKYWKHI